MSCLPCVTCMSSSGARAIVLDQGRTYGAATDIWALGCMLFELCTLRKAFEAANIASISTKILRHVWTHMQRLACSVHGIFDACGLVACCSMSGAGAHDGNIRALAAFAASSQC